MVFGVLTKEAIEGAEKEGKIKLKYRKELSSNNLDLRVKKLFRQKKSMGVIVISDKEEAFLDLFEEVKTTKGKWYLSPNEFYVAQTIEQLRKKDLFAKITSRSSWARYGIACFGITDEFQKPLYFDGNIDFTIKSLGPTVILRPGDAPAQIRFSWDCFLPLHIEQIKKIKDYEKIAQESHLNEIGFTLTLDKLIRLYKGGIIDPKKDCSDLFEEINIENGFIVNPNMFYLGASQQHIKIPPEYLGYIHLTDFPSDIVFTSHIVHGNAPFIDPYPKFEGKITFELNPVVPYKIREGMRVTGLQLIPLCQQHNHDAKLISRYKGQNKAETSKNHLKEKQLELFKEKQLKLFE